MSNIEWTDRSDWNPIRGCTRVSEGCRHCYAEAIAARFSDPGQPFHSFAERTPNGPRWTGKVALIEDRLTLPLKWRKPARIFVNSAFDLFHEIVPDEWIDRIFAVMALAPRHTFQILTKRSKRMREYCSDPVTPFRVAREMDSIAVRIEIDAQWAIQPPIEWPLINCWKGVTAEDQPRADERIPDLLATPAAVRFVSCEPMLGAIDMSPYIRARGSSRQGIMWTICGGESGPGARSMHPSWARSLRDQCAAAGVPFFFKQRGEWTWLADPMSPYFVEDEDIPDHPADWREKDRGVVCLRPDGSRCDGYGGHGEEFVYRVGKHRAGRLLDGREHNEFPA
jgi:protein gp37